MGSLALHAQEMNKKNDVIQEVLVHFDTVLIDSKELEKVKAAADAAYTDDLLFEKFEYWMDDRDEEVLLFHINAFFEDRHLKPLSPAARDLTGRRDEVEQSIKEKSRDRQKKIVSQRLSILATERKLATNEAIAKFVEMDVEQVRRYINGENKPQRATLMKMAEKFGVSLEYLGGFRESRN